MQTVGQTENAKHEPLVLPSAAVSNRRNQSLLARWLAETDIRLDGDRPWDPSILDDRVFGAVLRRGLTGLGDAYVEGWWECEALDQFFYRAMASGLPRRLRWHPYVIQTYLRDFLFNAQTRARAFRNGRAHYNLGIELFEATLDPNMAYSCGFWRDATSLEEAQTAKLDRVCRKLALKPGMRVLDIGCGWGSFVRHAARHYGVSCTGITVSDDQASYARDRCAGLDVKIILDDYRTLDHKFDRIASIGMFEHVGNKNYRKFMKVAHRCLAEEGVFLLHTFSCCHSFPNRTRCEVDWVERHIFPGLVVPSMKQIGAAVDGLFVIEDVENFGSDYDPTLMSWHANFERNWPKLAGRYDKRFRRMWRYYLMICAAAFRSRDYQVWQFVLSRRGIPGGYGRPV